MNHVDCVAFLQWALPRLHMRWGGFRKVRRQVCKRVARRIRDLGLDDVTAYRAYLERHDHEWSVLDGLCRVTISRFWRDKGTFEALRDAVIPELAREAGRLGRRVLRCWSAGCASGEEPYSVAILWRVFLAHHSPKVHLDIVATDSDPHLLARARAGCYPTGTLRDLPPECTEAAFETGNEELCLRAEFREGVTFELRDVRHQMPHGPFDLILCRNLVFTYFDEVLQRRILESMLGLLPPGGALVLGGHESLPSGSWPLESAHGSLPIFRRAPD